MCQMCSDLRGRATCPACGREICFDLVPAAEGPTLAYATLGGDIYCAVCGIVREAAETAEEQAVYYPREDNDA